MIQIFKISKSIVKKLYCVLEISDLLTYTKYNFLGFCFNNIYNYSNQYFLALIYKNYEIINCFESL